MPFKIGEAKEKYFAIDKLRENIKYLELAIDLKRKPVGVKFIFSKEDYDALDIPEVRGSLSYCKMIELSTKGKGSKSNLKNHSCDGGTTALGLEPSTDLIESGRTYYSYGLYNSIGSAKRMRDSIVSLHEEHSTYGMLIKPLSEFSSPPDVVMIIGNPYHMMRLTQGYTYNSGRKPNINYGAMQGVCSELTVSPYLSGEINISPLCPSTRMLAKWKEEEMGMGIPFEVFNSIVEGVMETIHSTEIKPKKKEILDRFKKEGIDINIDINKS